MPLAHSSGPQPRTQQTAEAQSVVSLRAVSPDVQSHSPGSDHSPAAETLTEGTFPQSSLAQPSGFYLRFNYFYPEPLLPFLSHQRSLLTHFTRI